MRTTRQRLSALLFVLFLALRASAAQAVEIITYQVTPDAAARQFVITLTVPRVQGPTLRVQIPTWSPGAYFLGNHAANITDVTARSASGETLTIRHPDKLTWEIAANGAKEVQVSYHATGADLQMADGKPKRGHLTGPRTLLYVVGRKEEPTRLALNLPPDWKIANSLDLVPSEENAFDAPNYDVLADAPSEMGDFAEDEFTVRGVPHKVVLYGDYAHVDRAKLKDICRRIAEAEIAFFDHVPFKHYIFQFRVGGPRGRGAGGLEHLGSTEIGFSGPVEDRTRSVIAHEYFHLWNVKRIRPAVLGPFDYTGPCRTANLWWSEGVTSYYGDLLSRRGGLNTEEEYRKHLADTISLLQSNPARLRVTADESSYKVWEGGGSQGFGRLSYYTKGELIGLCLDLKIRQVTDNRRSLDDVMRYLYYLCGRGNAPGFEEDGIKKAVNRVSGHDLSAFYDHLCRSTKEMPFAECLGYAGLAVAESDKPILTPDLGMFASPDAEAKGLRVRFLTTDGPAAKAGLKADDVIVAINGKPVAVGPGRRPGGDAPDLRSLKPEERVTLTVLRDGKPQSIAYTVGSVKRKQWILAPLSTATPEQTRLRESWLSGE